MYELHSIKVLGVPNCFRILEGFCVKTWMEFSFPEFGCFQITVAMEYIIGMFGLAE